MKTICLPFSLCAVLLVSNLHASPVADVGISAQTTNIVLYWPSSAGRIYLIEFRKTLTDDTQWGELENYFPAATATNVTEFVDTNVIPLSGDGFGGSGGGSGGLPNPSEEFGRTTTMTAQSSAPMIAPANGSGAAVPLAIYPPGFNLSGFVIFNPATGEAMSGNGYAVNSAPPAPTGGSQPMGDEQSAGAAVDSGFYRIFDVTPVANDDFFTVNQDSSANQLDIFQNDSDPNDDPIFISNLTSAQHGNIEYSSDASTFQYTPDSGFYGVDSFTYSVTSDYSDNSSNATITVFANQAGNSPPSAPDISITLPTNIYTATFNVLTNVSDPDGDTVALFAVNLPSLGSVSNDATGNIT